MHLKHFIWYATLASYIIIIISTVMLFNNDEYQVSNNITLMVEIFLGIFIAIIAYTQNKNNRKISQFFEKQIEYVNEDVEKCLSNIIITLYSTSYKLNKITEESYNKKELEENLQKIDFHYLHNTIYLDEAKMYALESLIPTMKKMCKETKEMVIHNTILMLTRYFNGKYTKKINYLIYDYIKKEDEFRKHNLMGKLNIQIIKQSRRNFILEVIDDLEQLCDQIAIHMKQPKLESINSFIIRTVRHIEQLQHIKKYDVVIDLEDSEINRIIKIYTHTKNIFVINDESNFKVSDLEIIIILLKEIILDYKKFMN